MDKSFKINVYFDEESEDVEKIIADYLVKYINNKNELNNKMLK